MTLLHLADARRRRQADEALTRELRRPIRSGPGLSLAIESGLVVVIADGRAELTPTQALDVASDLRALALDIGADRFDALMGHPPIVTGSEARARLGLLAKTLDGIDRGEKRVSDLVWLLRHLLTEGTR